jgi:hypothetical protein
MMLGQEYLRQLLYTIFLKLKMKIAFLTPEYPHPLTGNSGGIGTSIKNLAVGLVAAGCEVRILVYGQDQDAVLRMRMW